ncbi:MAG: STAS/SEC14 domain-containing protein [Solirubrobacterales bacterium]
MPITDNRPVITVRTDMPEGVLGFDISGEVTRADYDDVLMPLIIEHIESGEKVRALVQIGPDFEGYEAGAVWEDVKAGGEFGIGRHSSFERIAVVTDSRKLRTLASVFHWMAPGEVDVYKLKDIETAKAWTANG